MEKLPANARAYLFAVSIAGTAAFTLAQTVRYLPERSEPAEVLVFLLASVLAGGKKVKLNRGAPRDEICSMSLGFAVSFAALLMFGPTLAVLIAVTGCLSGSLYPKRQPFYQLIFNVSLGALEVFIASIAYLALCGWSLPRGPNVTIIAVVGSTVAYYFVNTFGVSAIIAPCQDRSLLSVWKEHFFWTLPSYFAAASVGVLGMQIFQRNPVGIMIFLAPVAYLSYQVYTNYAGKAEQQRRVDELRAGEVRSAELYLATIKSLALAIDAKDQYSRGHILRVQRYAMATAEELDLSEDEKQALKAGALLHDIGKLVVPEHILMKPGRLTPDEFEKIKKHPEVGAAILDPVEFPWPVLPVVKHHHERWDGTGYPDGLKGTDIPLTARVLAVADVYDALTSARSYRRPWTHQKAVEHIQSESGSHFDPLVVNGFVVAIEKVIVEIAREGQGPLAAIESLNGNVSSKAARAALDIARSSTEIWALYEVAQALSSSISSTETIGILCRKLEAIFPDVLCTFLLARKGDDLLRVGAASGINEEFFLGATTNGVRCRSMRVLMERRPYMGDYDPEDLLLTSNGTSAWTELRSCAIIPITSENEDLGTMNLYSAGKQAFGESDLHLLETIAERTGRALYNGMLFDRTRGDAMRDPITGLHNVRYLTEYLNDRCSEFLSLQSESPAPFAVLCMDLDNFKPINDNFGHQKGDKVLAELAAIFVQLVGQSGIVARYGGDEFVIVLNRADTARAREVVTDVRRAVQAYDPVLRHSRLGNLRIGISIGVAICPSDGIDCPSLINSADADMYRNKTERKLETLAKSEPSYTDGPDDSTGRLFR